MSSARTIRFEVARADNGKRLDQVLAANVPGLSRTRARLLLELGGVFVDKTRVKIASRQVRPGQVIEAHLGGALERATPALGRDARARDDATLPPFTVVHEDADVIVVDKPAGLLTAPTPESDRGNLADQLARRETGPVMVVHRIDLQTSGLLVFARTDAASRALSERFRVHDVDRVYLGALAGRLEGAREVDSPVAGKPARTRLEPVETFAAATLVRATLDTGRQHQIRVHAASLGHPVLGDRRHGERDPGPLDPPRMALHATHLGFIHPTSGVKLAFDSPLPADLAEWLERLRQGASESSK